MKNFETVAEMKLARLTAGQIVQTKGYYTAGDGGQAEYLIAAAQAVDEFGDHTLANSNVALLQIAGAVNLRKFGVVFDGVTDSTSALQAAIDSGLTQLIVDGHCTHTQTLDLLRDTSFVAPRGSGGLFASFVGQITYNPTAPAKSTINGAVSDSATTIPLTDASAFPNSGRIYVGNINGEYISYTGKSGNDLTGCVRDVGGGTIGATAYAGGETVWFMQPALQRISPWSGRLEGVRVTHAAFVDTATGWDDLGLAMYFPTTSYATVIDGSLIYGFEKAGFLGESFVSSLNHPMIYFCRYGFLMTVANAAVITEPDIGEIGDSGAVTLGWGFYFKDGNGAAIYGGNLGNAGLMVPVIADNHSELTVAGGYTEATNADHFTARNAGSIYVKSFYVKGASNLGRVETDGRIYIDGVEFENVTNERVVSGDDTGTWELKNALAIDAGDSWIPNQRGVGFARYELPHFTQPAGSGLFPKLRHSVTIPHNVATDLFKIQSRTPSAEPDKSYGLTLDYTYFSDYGGGYTSEKGILQIMVRHRRTLAPSVAIVKAGDVQSNFIHTLTATFSESSSDLGSDRWEVTFELTVVDAGTNGGILQFELSTSQPNRQDNLDNGGITLL